MLRPALILAAAVSIGTQAGELQYKCEIRQVFDIDHVGTLKQSIFQPSLAGKKFLVSRKTGEITGDALVNLDSKDIRIVNQGDRQYSFKLVATAGGNAQLLEIQEFLPEKMKPFIAMSMGGVGLVTGICE